MNEVKNYLMYFISVSLLFLFLFISIKIFEDKNNLLSMKVFAMVKSYENERIEDKNKNIDINYPIFGYEVLDEHIKKIIKKYKNIDNTKIDYEVYTNKKLTNIFFKINQNSQYHYESLNYSIEKEEFINKDKILDLKTIKESLLNKIKTKYSSYIYEKILEDDLKSVYIKINEKGTYIYFNSELFENILHEVYIYYPSEEDTYVSEIKYDKVIAFTFDDGPSKYTKEIVDTLIANDSKATFFELGNRMKYNQEIVLDTYNRGMEIASHTYAHKNLNKLNEANIDEEVNSTNIIFNEITGANIPYVRPPYGNANEKVKSRIGVPLINWSIDTEDWLTRNSDTIYNHILTHVNDGDIVLMHDIYPETLEAVKKVLPVLRERGYKITTVSELANEKGIELKSGIIYRSFKNTSN